MTIEQTHLPNIHNDEAFRFLGIPTQLRASSEASNGAFGLLEHRDMPAGFASPYHTHTREDESFYVMEGKVAFIRGGEWLEAGPGTFVYGPRGIAHGFQVIGAAPARMLLMCTPGGFEGFVLEQAAPLGEPPSPPDMDRLMTLAREYGIEIHSPLPPLPEGFGGTPSVGLKELNQRWIDAFNKQDWVAEDVIRGEGFRAYLSGAPEPLESAAWSGFLQSFATAFPDAHITIDSCITEGDTVATRWSLTGTHQGTFQGIAPTGRPIRFHGIEYNRVSGGRFVEHWSMFDNLALLAQIGALPA